MLLRLPEATGAELGLHTLTLTFANLLQTAKLVGTGAYGQAYSDADTEPAGNIARDLAKRGFVKCPRIKTFMFSYGAEIHLESGLNISRMVDHEMVAIVQALPKDLEELRLDNTFVTGVMALDSLETCAGLAKFVAPSIAADELYLHAHFSGVLPVRPPGPRATPTDHEKHRTALRQHKIVCSKLAELTWLDKLWLGVPGRLKWYDGEESDDEATIRKNDAKGEVMLNLATGLDTLANLKRLRTLVIIGLGQKITMGDVQ
ncbi:hypothetical protein BGZ59_001286 [Podila verticillata]|nr:hypothetical protein BGZ59_001286 [Podila verticillata]